MEENELQELLIGTQKEYTDKEVRKLKEQNKRK